ncbi:Gfo/Idh/MocA family oxidoreductase [Sphingomonas sp.]|uniref:Gfo/Idh/MocA family protein n=1 Tax=Sphingomonas sp. TaxID=28214 RepID=UPI002CD908F5|nr:Gfo/Idh/MocA family oxidoreductase [Sphingomonas sp.]HTG38135.1 Gfo/Idh/MocA family oxidoreductase [Sphingomonas sp.]
MSTAPIRVALVGLGKIARDQHIPAMAGNDAFELAATVSPNAPPIDGVRHFRSFDALIDSDAAVDAVALCTPPQARTPLAFQAIERGLHVMLEKPPAATLSEVEALVSAAGDRISLFATWHSRYAAGVARAKAWLATREIRSVEIVWREDVRVWHPGQAWIWEPGGLGVFDPGINALSIATDILPRPVYLRDAVLEFPANRAAPIAARLTLADTRGAAIDMDLDWRQEGPQSWDIRVDTDAGRLLLEKGGAVLNLDGETHVSGDVEYPGLYARFADLIRAGASDVDPAPFRLVADAFLRGRRKTTDPFVE